MTTELDALLAAIIAEPADDTRRMAYADKCRELGDEDRADFIETQLEMARWGQPPGDDFTFAAAVKKYEFAPEGMNLAALYRRSQELLAAPHASLSGRNCGVWSAPIPVSVGLYGPEPFAFRRGFVASVRCTAEQWVFSGDVIRARHPVEQVTLTTRPRLIPRPDPARAGEMVGHGLALIGDPAEVCFHNAELDAKMQEIIRTHTPRRPCVMWPSRAQALLPLRWPGVAFTLPGPERVPDRPRQSNGVFAPLPDANALATAGIRAAAGFGAAVVPSPAAFARVGDGPTTPTPPAGPPPATS